MKSFNEWLEKRDPEYHESWRDSLERGASAVKAASDKVPGWVKKAGMIGAGALLGGGVGAGMAAAGATALSPAVATGLVGGAGAITGAKYLAQQDMERRAKKADVRRKRPGFPGW